VHLVGFIIRIYEDAQLSECQNQDPVTQWCGVMSQKNIYIVIGIDEKLMYSIQIVTPPGHSLQREEIVRMVIKLLIVSKHLE
jgi:hypothetical protein